MAILAVLYDSDRRLLLGVGGKWVTCAEFEKHPPKRPEDLVPSEATRIEESDPGPTYKCINHVLYVCDNNRCYSLSSPC